MDAGELPALVVGGGPAGLATSAELCRRGVEHRLLERGERVGASWAKLYDSLRLHTGKHLSHLPGMRFGDRVPLFPTRDMLLEYLERYVERFSLPVDTGREALAVTLAGETWRVETNRGALAARHLVVATGIMSTPVVPELPGRERYSGRVLHAIDYRRPAPYRGQRVLVVGSGNSAGEIAAELAAEGVAVTLAVRSGARVVPLTLFGLPIQYCAWPLAFLPRGVQRACLRGMSALGEWRRGPAMLPPGEETHCPDVPLIGLRLEEALRSGRIERRPALAGFGDQTVRFADGGEERFDAVILATGYRATLGFLGELGARDDCGFARRADRVASAVAQRLWFVGQNYDNRGGLYNIRLDARAVAKRIAAA